MIPGKPITLAAYLLELAEKWVGHARGGGPVPDSDYAMDFFVSHADADTQWAEWIAAELERAGYGVIVKAWDFRPGENSLSRHDEALATCRHTLCVLSPAYVE